MTPFELSLNVEMLSFEFKMTHIPIKTTKITGLLNKTLFFFLFFVHRNYIFGVVILFREAVTASGQALTVIPEFFTEHNHFELNILKCKHSQDRVDSQVSSKSNKSLVLGWIFSLCSG